MLTNNRIYKKLKKALNLKTDDALHIFSLGGLDVSKSLEHSFGIARENRRYIKMSDAELEAFLEGLIILKRGQNANN